FFFFNDTATTEIYTLSLHDALPISDPFEERRAFEVRHGAAIAVIQKGSGDSPCSMSTASRAGNSENTCPCQLATTESSVAAYCRMLGVITYPKSQRRENGANTLGIYDLGRASGFRDHRIRPRLASW